MRTISTSGYPLIGPYSSDNPQVFRWHVRLAKAAGIDGFLVAVFPGTEPTFFGRFERMLRVAYEEDFKIGFEGWTPDVQRVGEWQSETVRYLDHFANHSPFRNALLRINGKPVFWFNLSGRTQGLDEVAAFFDRVEAFWVFSGGMSVDEEQELKARLTRSIATRDTQYNYPTDQGFAFIGDFGRQVHEKLERGLYAFSHGFPGYDEQMASSTEGRSGRFGLRHGGQTLRDYLEAGRDSRVHGIIISSWNEWFEMSTLEPGFDALFRAPESREAVYGNDPYAMLRIIAQFKDIPWNAPAIPCHIVDRLLIRYKVLRCRP